MIKVPLLECKSGAIAAKKGSFGKRIRDASIYTSKKISLKLLFLSDIFFDVYILASRIRLRMCQSPFGELYGVEVSHVPTAALLRSLQWVS